MNKPFYMDLSQARELLAQMGVELNERQMKRAAEADSEGRRKLPFFVDPIDGRLKIEKNALISAYRKRQIQSERNLRPG